MENIKIDLLKYHPEAIPALGKLLLSMFKEIWNPDTNPELVESWLLEWCNEIIPLAYIALDRDKPVGIGSLQINDGIRPDLMPWMGDLCIDKAYQKHGIGKALIQFIQNKAKEFGHSELFLFTHNPDMINYYNRLGWQEIDRDKFNGHSVIVMKTRL